jgi:class 3 adenylate cyclase/ADP-ribose pyrophosphatase YjhB (NUDIX family)
MVTADGRREFTCFPAAILAFIVNRDDEVLLLSHPARKGAWEIVNGAIYEGESPVAALLRETSEEAGPGLIIRPVASVHTFLYRFDAAIPAMFSIAYVATHIAGDVAPGSDMAMSDFRWASLGEIESEQLSISLPSQLWLFRRALAVHTLFKDEQVELEPWQPVTPRGRIGTDRTLTALLFTDVVNSSDTTVRVGDRAWLDLLGQHDRVALDIVHGYGGRIVKHTGDGLFAVFGSVRNAVAAGRTVQQRANLIGLAVRAGVHAGEVEVLADDVIGQAVVLAARVCASAVADELLVSETAAHLLAGSDVRIEDARTVNLKGIGETIVFAASTTSS